MHTLPPSVMDQGTILLYIHTHGVGDCTTTVLVELHVRYCFRAWRYLIISERRNFQGFIMLTVPIYIV